MNRKDFIQSSVLGVIGMTTLQDLRKFADTLHPQDDCMPVLFVGHGSPMNAIEENEFTQGWQNAARKIPTPKAILCISAHWETEGTWITAMPKPKTIHDFYGFPQSLFDVQYPAPGSLEWAKETANIIHKTQIGLDESQWGFDHGCWSVLKHFYPKADIPVLQLSLDHSKPAQWHYDLARELAVLRRKGVLIISSGNMVHNLGMISFSSPNGYDWAIAANATFKKLIENGDHQGLVNYSALGKEIRLSIPTPEHYLPLLYTLALKEEKEPMAFFNDKTMMGSISMTSLRIG